MFPKAVEFAHRLFRERVNPGDVVVDATCGNGHDTLALAALVGRGGLVYGFDRQPDAVVSTRRRLTEKAGELTNWRLIEACHSEAIQHLDPSHVGVVSMTVFNFGYLPGGDKTETTRTRTSLMAVRDALHWTRPGGAISLAIYPGHEEGRREAEALREWASALDPREFQSLEYRFLNLVNDPPFVIAISKSDAPR